MKRKAVYPILVILPLYIILAFFCAGAYLMHAYNVTGADLMAIGAFTYWNILYFGTDCYWYACNPKGTEMTKSYIALGCAANILCIPAVRDLGFFNTSHLTAAIGLFLLVFFAIRTFGRDEGAIADSRWVQYIGLLAGSLLVGVCFPDSSVTLAVTAAVCTLIVMARHAYYCIKANS